MADDLNKPDDDDIVKHSDYGTNQLENVKFAKNLNDRVVVRTDDEGTQDKINRAEVLGLTKSSGLQDGETYDSIIAGPIDAEENVIQYELGGICQFQIEIVFVGPQNFRITKRVCEFDLLQENGFVLLQENDDALRTEGLVP